MTISGSPDIAEIKAEYFHHAQYNDLHNWVNQIIRTVPFNYTTGRYEPCYFSEFIGRDYTYTVSKNYTFAVNVATDHGNVSMGWADPYHFQSGGDQGSGIIDHYVDGYFYVYNSGGFSQIDYFILDMANLADNVGVYPSGMTYVGGQANYYIYYTSYWWGNIVPSNSYFNQTNTYT
jgi:hypothetical protein